jgi:hypothetical protein
MGLTLVVVMCITIVAPVMAQPTPFVIDGCVNDSNGVLCNDPWVRVTNTNTGASWDADNSTTSNYYRLVLGSDDVNAGEMLRFNVTDGTNASSTDHTMTDDEVNAGGLFDFNLTLESSADTTPPVITDVANETPTSGSVTITWTTDEVSDSLVKYGIDSDNYTDEVSDATMTTSHAVQLSGLDPDTTYYFVVNSTDASNNGAESSEYSFVTAAESQNSDLTVTLIETPANIRNDVINPISATIENIGVSDASSFDVSLKVDSTTVDTATITSLAAGGNTTVELLWTPDATGGATLTMTADANDAMTESDETNNDLSKTVDVLEKLTITANVRVEGKNDTVWAGDVTFSNSTVTATDGSVHYLNEPTALGALDEANKTAGFGYLAETSLYGLYVSEVNSEPPIGWDGWMYRVNYASAVVGAADYTLADSDEVLWYFGAWTAPPLVIELDKTSVDANETFTATVTAYNGTEFLPVDSAGVYIDDMLYNTTGPDGTLTLSIGAAGSYRIHAEKGTWADYTRSGKKTVIVAGQTSNNVYLTPASSSASYGNTATVDIYANTADGFQGGQFYLDCGSGCANVTDITFGSIWQYTSSDLTTYPGAVFATFRKDNPMVSAAQHICTVTIRCENPAYCVEDLHFVLEDAAPAGKDSKLFDDVGVSLTDVAWNGGTFTGMNLPDLVITEVYGVQQTGNDYVVSYTVKNEGNADAAAGHTATLYIDGTSVEDMALQASLTPGESYTCTFATVLTMTEPNNLMKVCADTGEGVMELDETNNCMDSYYPAGIEIRVDTPDDCVDFNEQFIVNVTVDPRNIPVYGIQYLLSFDNSVLHAEWQNEGTFLSQDGAATNVYINTIDNGRGLISFAATRLGTESGVATPGTLATIKFTAIKQGANSTLNLSNAIAANNNGGEILPLDLIPDVVCVHANMQPVAIGKSMHRYNNDGQKYLCKVHFDATESYDPDGEIVSWRWGFGDGTYGAGESLEHVYRSWKWNGSGYDPFTVSLTVIDNSGPHELDNTTFFDVIVYTAGDANGDGRVNILDATLVGLEWSSGTVCGWDGDARADRADLNNDGNVDILDAVIVGTCWEHTAW